ncbi:MAG: PAS domain S-box protein [Caldilinea sp. CFX5]|nr:PAS domain S-box protein [Caldilinea sp. CFX5]
MITQNVKQIDVTASSRPTGALDLSSTTPLSGAFPVVGVVGAAGSRLALEKFFRTLPTDAGMAFIVVTRLAAKEQRLLSAALQARTDLPVSVATDGVLLQSDQIYLVPSGVQPTVAQGRLHLQPIANTPAHRRFDPFLTSLAEEQGANAVALLLSGAGEDGLAGLQAIKAQGGLVLVQEPNEAAHPALPRRGAATGIADCVGKAAELAQWLVQSRGDLANQPLPEQNQDEHFLQTLPALLAQIAGQTGHDLSHYKRSTLQRRILRQMRAAGASALGQYLELLKTNAGETLTLFRACLVSVTSFFRDADAYAMLERDCIPQLFQGKGRSDLVRVWVAGCATGEEAYSVAMQLAERAAQITDPPRWQIFATDLDEAAITIARRGLYPATIAKDIAPGRLQRYFTEENGCYRVKPEIRENILFAAHDLLRDPPFSRLDLICCRNVLIYFTRPAQEKVFATFHYALNPSGYLFLGASESIDAANDLFAVLNKQCHLYQRRNITLLPPRRPLGHVITPAPAALEHKMSERLTPRATEKVRTLEESYAAWSLRVHTPPRLLVNQHYEITHLFGGAERYLQTRDGAITQNVLQRIHPDLRLELRAALYQAFNQRERTISRLLPLVVQQRTELIQLQVGPVTEPGFPADYVEVVLVAQENPALLELGTTIERKASDLSLVSRLEEELLRTRERLQQIIDEYETAGQELKVSNEELQSINEELKSTTEELETSKEELQSMNEELTTVNGELTRKIEELHRANSDLLNLIASTEVGAIFLNPQLQINRFTPRATDLFNLIEGDIGRPFAHVTHRLRHSDLPTLAAQVQAGHDHIEETLQRDDDRWFMLRLFPYRTVTGENDGVVLTFIDIHDIKRAESEERQRRQQQSLAELSRQALTGVDLDTFFTAVTHRVAEVLDMELCSVLQLQPDGKMLLLRAGVGWQSGLVGRATVPAAVSVQAGYTLQANAPVIVRDLQTESRFRASDLLRAHAVRSGISVTIPVTDPATPTVETRGAYGVLGVHSRQLRAFTTYDIDYLQAVANLLAATIARRTTESALRREEERYRFIFDTVGVSIWEEDFTAVQALIDQLRAQGVDNLRAYLTEHPAVVAQAIAAVRIHNVNQQTVTLFGANDKAQLLASLDRIFIPATEAIFVEEIVTLAEGRGAFAAETVLQTLQGEQRHVLFTITFPMATRLDRVLVNIVDITERKVAEEARQRYADLLRLSHDAIMIWRPEGGIEFWNHGAETLYGYTAAEALGRMTHELLQTAHFRPWPEILAELQRNGLWEGEVIHTAKTGRRIIVSTRHQLITNADGDRLILETNRDITDRKESAALLARYQLLSEQTRDIILFIRPDGRLVEANDAAVEAYGYDRATLLNLTVYDLRAAATHALIAEQMTQADQAIAGHGIRFETLHRRQDGSVFPVEVSSIGADVGGERLLLSVIRDISERKAAEAALAASEAKFATAFSLSPLILTITTLADGRLLEVNESFVQLTGYSRAEALGRTPIELGLWVNPDERAEGLAHLAAGERWQNIEAVFRMKNGALKICLLGATVVTINGQACALTALTDITERKAAEAALRQSEERFVTIFQHSPYPIAILALATRTYVDVNPTWVRDTGYTRAEAVGRTPAELGLQTEQPLNLTERLRNGEVVRDQEIQVRIRNGEVRTALVSAELIQLTGQPHILLVFTDITARKQAEERLHFLAEAGALLAGSLDYTITLQNVAHAAVPGIADWCVIDLLAEDGSFLEGVIAHRDPAKVRWAQELRTRYPIDPNAPLGAPQVVRTGQSELYPDVTDAMLQAAAKNETELQLLRSVGYRSVMIVPLQTHGRTLGVITFVATDEERHFTTADLTMAEELARRAAAVIGNAQLHQALQQREQALRASEERLRLATEAGRIGIYDHDLLANHTVFSDIYHAITGVDPNERLTREAWLTRVHPADRALVSEKLARALTAGESHEYDYRIYHPDGTVRWVGVSSRVIVDATGRAVRLTGAIRDITDRKRAEEEIQRLNRDLKRRVDELQTLLDVAPIGIFVAHDAECRLITGNPAGASMLGVAPMSNASKSKATGDPLPFRVLHGGREVPPDELPMQYAAQHDVTVENMEYEIIRSDGTQLNLYEYAIPLHDEEGRVRGCLGIFVDITERKQVEAALRESEERFRSAFEQAAVGMAHINSAGQYIRVNDRLCQILGYDRATLLQMKFLDLTHPEDRANSLTLSERLLAGEIASYNVEKRYLRHDGVIIWVNISASAVRNETGEITYRLSVIEDITARKAAEAALHELTATLEQRVHERTIELERSNRELDQFAYVASHDLKAPLRAIINLAGWIAEDAGSFLPAPSLEHLQKLRGRAFRMERLLDDLLIYSRLGRRSDLSEPVPIDRLLQDIVEMLAPPPGFTITTTGALPVLTTARAPLELVLRNLINNAIKHHHQPAQGVVTITVQAVGAFLEFAVSDNGPGIDPQHHERIFGLFQTLRPRDDVEGSGMGLAIVKKAVEQRNGTIRLTSAPNQGTTFYFTWPLTETNQSSNQQPN